MTDRQKSGKLTDKGKNFIAGILGDTVEIVPGKEMIVCGCRRILEYGDCEVLLDCHGGNIRVKGQGLRMQRLLNGELGVAGKILFVEFFQ